MHLGMLLLALLLTWMGRLVWLRFQPLTPAGSSADQTDPNPSTPWNRQWRTSLGALLFPPLLLAMTAIAIVSMGPQGHMVGWSVGWSSYLLACAWCLYCLGTLVYLGWRSWRSHHQVQQYGAVRVGSTPARLLDTPALFAAQMGLWRMDLVVSQGLLDSLTAEELEALVSHEQAHAHFRDPFWFFWLGWLRRITLWLPGTESLWQELLLLRELRADRWAAQQVDPLTLAETLLKVVSFPHWNGNLEQGAIAACTTAHHRLDTRITALLEEDAAPLPSAQKSGNSIPWGAIAWSFLPLLTLPFHH